jgi:hypothetical protein
MRQREISKYRVMQAFVRTRKTLASREICKISGLRRSTVSPCLGELEKEGSVKSSLSTDRKTKFYRPQELQKWKKPLKIDGPRQKKQFERLLRMGLHVMWVGNPRGRPKNLISRQDFVDAKKMTENLWGLQTGTRYVARSIPDISLEDRTIHGRRALTYAIPGDRRREVMKQIDQSILKAKSHLKKLRRERNAGRGYLQQY